MHKISVINPVHNEHLFYTWCEWAYMDVHTTKADAKTDFNLQNMWKSETYTLSFKHKHNVSYFLSQRSGGFVTPSSLATTSCLV